MCVECIAVPHWPSSLPLLSSIQPKIRHTNSLIDFVEKFANERKDMVVVVSYPNIICVTVGLQHPTGRYKCSRRNWNRVVELVGLGLALYQRDNSSGALLGLLGQFYLYFGELARRPLCRLLPPGPFQKTNCADCSHLLSIRWT